MTRIQLRVTIAVIQFYVTRKTTFLLMRPNPGNLYFMCHLLFIIQNINELLAVNSESV